MRGSRLAPAVAAVENTNKVDQQTLRSIDRLGIADRIIFFDLNAATEKRDWVLEYSLDPPLREQACGRGSDLLSPQRIWGHLLAGVIS